MLAILAEIGVSDLAVGTKSLMSESLVLATIFLVAVGGFVTLRFAAWPLAKTVLEIVREISGITAALKGMVDRVEKAADRLDEHECKV